MIFFLPIDFCCSFRGYNTYGQLGQGSTSYLGNNAYEMGDYLPPIDIDYDVSLCFSSSGVPEDDDNGDDALGFSGDTGDVIGGTMLVIFGVGMVGVFLYFIQTKYGGGMKNTNTIDLERSEKEVQMRSRVNSYHQENNPDTVHTQRQIKASDFM